MLTNSIADDIKYKFRYGNMAVKLIFINIGVFVLTSLFYLVTFLFQQKGIYEVVLSKVEVPASVSTLLYQPWSVFTYMFLHAGFFHILFNMLWFYWFSEILVVFLGDNTIPVFIPKVEVSYMLGASASVFAVVFAAATLSPDYEVRLLLFGVVRIKYIALVALVLDIINIPNGNAGGYIAHLGGALAGFLYIKALQSGFDAGRPFNKLFDGMATLFKPRPKVRVTHKSSDEKTAPKSPRSQSDQEKIDEILDKISRSGYDSLTKEEKDFLFHYSRKG
jgi:membrane associated rhomboid family serine protease